MSLKSNYEAHAYDYKEIFKTCFMVCKYCKYYLNVSKIDINMFFYKLNIVFVSIKLHKLIIKYCLKSINEKKK